MQTRNRLFDDLAKVANSAFGTVASMKEEIEHLVRYRVENFIGNMDLVNREEFDVVQAMAVKTREKQELLEKRIVELETKLKARTRGTAQRKAATPRTKASIRQKKK